MEGVGGIGREGEKEGREGEKEGREEGREERERRREGGREGGREGEGEGERGSEGARERDRIRRSACLFTPPPLLVSSRLSLSLSRVSARGPPVASLASGGSPRVLSSCP